VVVSAAVKDLLESDPLAVIICEQCAMTPGELVEVQPEPLFDDGALCPICERLREQEEAASIDKARCNALIDKAGADEANRKWAHLFHARWEHRRKAHGRERRGST